MSDNTPERKPTKVSRSNHWMPVALGLTLCVLLAFALRVYNLGTQSLWTDEGYSIHLASQPLSAILTDIVSDHSPLYYVVLHFWMPAAGQSEFAVRFVSVCGGLLVVALTYTVGRRIMGRPVALLAAFLMAIAPLHVYYAQEARTHILVTALGLASIYFMIRLLDLPVGPSSHRHRFAHLPICLFIAYALVTAAGLWAFYYFALLILAQNVWVTCYVLRAAYHRHRTGSLVRRWIVAQLAVALLFAPWALYAAPRVLESFRLRAPAFGFASLDLFAALRLCLETFGVGPTMDPNLALALSLPLAILAVIGLLAPRTRHRVLLICWLGVPVLAAWLVNLRFPPFLPRYLLLATPAYYLLAASGLAVLLPQRMHHPSSVIRQASNVRRQMSRLTFDVLRFTFCAILLLITLIAGFSLNNNYHRAAFARDDYRGVAAAIRRHSAADETLVLNAWWQDSMFDYYDPGPLAQYGVPEKGQLPAKTRTEAAIAAVAERHPAIWLCLYGSTAGDPDNVVEKWLNHHCTRVWSGWFGQVRLLRYLTPGPPNATPAHPAGSRHEGLVLLGLDAPTTVEAGANIPIDLYWQAQGRIRADYSAALRLVDAQGRVWSWQDGAPLAGFYPTSTWPKGEQVRDRRLLPVPWGTPPGEYAVAWQVYALGQPPAEASAPVRVTVTRPTRTPQPGDLALDRPAHADFDGVRLRGAGLDNPTARAGDPFQMDLLWECTGPVPTGLQAVVELRDTDGATVAQSAMPLDSTLEPGELRRQMHTLPIPATVRDGEYQLWLTLRRPDGSPVPVRWWFLPVADGVDLGPVPVVGRPHSFDVPSIEHPLSAQLGDSVRLLGYDLKPADGSNVPRAGVDLRVILYWQCIQPLDTSYTVFCHLVGAAGAMGPQQDDLPCLGQCPTTSWVPNEVLTDEHTIILPLDLPPGPYTLLVGMYDAQTMQRLPVVGGGDAVRAGTVDIAPAR